MKSYSSSSFRQQISRAVLLAQNEQARRALASRQSPDAEREPFARFLERVSPTFTWDVRHLAHIRTHLERVTRGECKRLMLSVPPRHGKSEMTTVRYPVHRLKENPTMRVIIGAYNQTLATKFTRKSRMIARAEIELATDRQASDDWETTQGGGMRAIGVGSGVTGTGGDLIIIDDPVKSREEAESVVYREKVWDWYKDDLYTRLEPGGAIILIMTRWHKDDLAGRILEERSEHWDVINLPALAEQYDQLGRAEGEPLWAERFGTDELANIQRVLGEYSFSALYQQRPRPKGLTLFKEPFYYDNLPEAYQVVMGLDTAYTAATKSDYSVLWTAAVQGDKVYVMSVDRWQGEFDQTIRKIQNMQDKYNAVVAVEANGPQKMMADMLQRSGVRIRRIIRTTDKYSTSQQFAAAWNRGDVLVPSNRPAWLRSYVDEITAFTGAGDRTDDQVDASVNGFMLTLNKPSILL